MADYLTRAVFKEKQDDGGGGGGDTGNPFGIPDPYWDYVLKPDVKDFLSDPAGNDKNGHIVFGFKGLWNDTGLKRDNVGSQTYAEQVAEVVNYEASLHGTGYCVIDVKWGGVLNNWDVERIKDKIRNW